MSAVVFAKRTLSDFFVFFWDVKWHPSSNLIPLFYVFPLWCSITVSLEITGIVSTNYVTGKQLYVESLYRQMLTIITERLSS